MVKIFIMAFAFIGLNAFGQTSNQVFTDSLLHDTTLKVIYTNTETQLQTPAYFLNGQLINETTIKSLDPMTLDSIHVVHKIIQVDNIQYYSEFYLKTKREYDPKLISLSNLKEKYTNVGNKKVIFMLDGELVNADFDKCLIDENYLLRIIVEQVKNAKEDIDPILIRLLTKSAENIKKANEIRIRGTN